MRIGKFCTIMLGLTLALVVTTVYAEQTSTIRDRKISGRKAEIRKVGDDYTLQTMLHSKTFMLCNKDDDASPNYYGFEAADGSWYILKETVSAGADTYQYNLGTSSYTTGWTNRTSASYQNWGDEW